MNQDKAVGFFSNLPDRLRKEIVLPSGRKVTILETTGKQEALFRGMTANKAASVISKFLSEITENLDEVEGSPQPSKLSTMLQWDRSTILLHVRLLSHGPIVNYKINCSKCGSKSEHEIDIEPIIASIKPYPFGDQREFYVDLDGGRLHFELPDGETEKRLSETGEADVNKRLAVLKIWEETSKGRLPVNLENLKSKHIAALRKKLKELEAEIDAIVTLVCPTSNCGQTYQLGLVENPDFLFPNLM